MGCSDDDSAECGNDVIETGEDCEGQDLDGRTCQSLGLGGGVLLCSASCEYDPTRCFSTSCSFVSTLASESWSGLTSSLIVSCRC